MPLIPVSAIWFILKSFNTSHFSVIEDEFVWNLTDNPADDLDKSVINEQVENGVAVRMACMSIMVK